MNVGNAAVGGHWAGSFRKIIWGFWQDVGKKLIFTNLGHFPPG